MADPEARRDWRTHIFGSVAELGDLDYQKATWLDLEMQNPHFSFVEFVECFYDASLGGYDEIDPNSPNAPLKYHLDQGHISGRERDIVWPVHLALKDYRAPTDDYDHDSILSDNKWLEVVAVAKNASEKLKKIFDDPIDLRLLDNRLSPSQQKLWL